ncbi:hypothetical protein [Teredinibacter turnerae]|uniref:hypothetical protein n=1 Tax=Teredinibacter turnerae TaxID=2426 RepID=UPI0005F84AB8|nr:hypothetical protein [Teredinibacter turnerae]
MDELERLASQAETEELSEAQAKQSEPVTLALPAPVVEHDRTEAAENRAESVLKILEGGVKLLIDSRIHFSEDNYKDGRESLGAVIEKYDIQGDGTGRLPLEEEIRAGFFVGALLKTVYRSKRYLTQHDKAEQEKQQRHGEERKHASTQQSHSVLSEVGLREDSDVAPPFRHS